MSETESLKRIEAALLDGENVGKALRLLQQFITDRPDPAVSGVLESVSQDYELMKDFMLKGYHDDKRAMLYEGMLRKLYRVWGYLRVSVKVQESQAYRLAATVVPPVSLHPDDIRRRLVNRRKAISTRPIKRISKGCLMPFSSHLNGIAIRPRVSSSFFCRRPSTQMMPNCW